MPFVFDKRLNGEIWVPEASASETKKHPCSDCETCAQCGESRCRFCRRKQNCSKPRTP